jgi:hypothetical protein
LHGVHRAVALPLRSGAPQQTERFMFEGDMQRKVHSVVDYNRAAPVNFGVCTLKQSVLGLRGLRFYTAEQVIFFRRQHLFNTPRAKVWVIVLTNTRIYFVI